MQRVTAAPAPQCPSGADVSLPADLARLPELAAFAREQACRACMSETAAARLRLILEELFVNVCTHGNAGRTDELDPFGVNIHCELRAQDSVLLITFSDTAPAFDPLVPLVPLASAPAEVAQAIPPLEDIPIGGQGLHLVRTLAQKPRYARMEGRNILRFSLPLT